MSDALITLCAQIARVDRRRVKIQTTWMPTRGWKKVKSLNIRLPSGTEWGRGRFLPFTQVTIDDKTAVYICWDAVVYRDGITINKYHPQSQLKRLKKKLAVALTSWAKGGQPRKIVIDVPGRKRLRSVVA